MKMRNVPIQFVAALTGMLPLCSCGAASSKPAKTIQPGEAAPGVRLVAHLTDAHITESSGLAASRKYPGCFWTHNDGKREILFAIDRTGATQAFFRVAGVAMADWEDIANDDAGHLYLGDIGNNDAKRTELAVHEVDEPNPAHGTRVVVVKRTWRLAFPGAPFDCEALFVWKGQGYVVSKVFNDARAQVYRFALKDTAEPQTLELVATTKIESPVTGADISPDGALLAFVAKNGAYVQRIDGDVTRAGKGKLHHTRFKNEHIEACAFVPEGLMATSEDREIFLFTDGAFLGKGEAKVKTKAPAP